MSHKWETRRHDDTMFVDISYPNPEEPTYVEVGLMHVRAADNVRLHYDFERDGWAVHQATRFQWEDGEAPDPGWVEVAFVEAWGSQVEQ